MEGDCSHEIKRCFLLGRKVYTNLDSILKSRDIILPTKVCMLLNCDGEDPESLFVCKIKSVNPKGNQSWIFIGRTDAEVEAPVPWPPDTVRQLWKRPCCWERLKTKGEGGCREWDDRWHHQLNGHKFEQIPGDGGGQRNLACYSPCDYKKWDTISQFNSNNDDTHDSKPSLL